MLPFIIAAVAAVHNMPRHGALFVATLTLLTLLAVTNAHEHHHHHHHHAHHHHDEQLHASLTPNILSDDSTPQQHTARSIEDSASTRRTTLGDLDINDTSVSDHGAAPPGDNIPVIPVPSDYVTTNESTPQQDMATPIEAAGMRRALILIRPAL